MNKLSNHVNISPRQHAVMCTLLSFIIPCLVFTLAMLALLVSPFGNHNIAISDGQYYINGSLFFNRMMRGQENFIYSLQNGLGGNEWSQLAWGGFSFGGLLSVLGTLETMPSLFTWICMINIAVCGLTMYSLLAYIRGHQISNLIFSTSYSLIGFNIVNCYQTGFFLGPEMLPLVLLGLYKLMKGKSPLTYILSLSFCIFFNFYFGFHLCIISIIYYIVYLWVNKEELNDRKLKTFITWAASSLIAGFLAAPMWLPTLKAYSGGGRLNQTGLDEYTFSENKPFIQIFSKLFTGANSTNELIFGLPNIFCGILIVALVILFFMNMNIDSRRRRAAGIVLAFYLLTFYLPALTIAMHGGTHTNWFPYRYSYVFSFLLICLAVEEFNYLETITLQETKQCGEILLIAVILIFSTSYEFISGGDVVLDLALLLVMWAGFWFYKTKPDKTSVRVLSELLLIVVCVNLYANTIISIKKMQEWELDLKLYNEKSMVYGALVDAINQAEDGFFRMEKDESESGSVGADPVKYNYNGVSHSGPAERSFIHKQLCKLGINWFDMRHWYSEGIPAATDSLMGLKYILSDRNLNSEKNYENRIKIENISIYQNDYALSVAILADADARGVELSENVFNNLNCVWKKMSGGEDNIFSEQKDITFTAHNAIAEGTVESGELEDFFSKKERELGLTSDESSVSRSGFDVAVSGENTEKASTEQAYIEYSFTAVKDGPVYVFDTSIPGSVQGKAIPGIKCCGIYHKGDKVTGKLEDIDSREYITDDFLRGYCANLVFASADNDVLEKYALLLNDRDITFDPVHENDIHGSFTAEKGQCILFTLPWDEGWTCYIDGKKVPIDKTWDLFMSVEAPEGEHTYELKFFPAWMDYGIYLFVAAVAGLIVLMVSWSRSRKKDDSMEAESLDNPESEACEDTDNKTTVFEEEESL